MKRGTRGVLWEGLSPFDGAPIVAIVTPTSNEKTGPMPQVWILPRDVNPLEAVATGADTAVCGKCPLRGPKGYARRGCYVQVHNAPRSVWQAYQRGLYEPLSPSSLAGRMVRWGAYGDPAMLPWQLVTAVNARSRGWTGYTHLWRHRFAEPFKGIFMASVETTAQEARAHAAGWGTFRAGRVDGADQGDAELCRNNVTGESCIECRACDGRPSRIYIPAHGPGRFNVPASRLLRRRAG